MHILDEFTINTHVWGEVNIAPRLEAIMTTIDDCENAELLCTITRINSVIPPAIFFKCLTEYEHVKLFRLILSNIAKESKNRKYRISINTPIEVIRNFSEFFPLFNSFEYQKYALEILEDDVNKFDYFELGVLEIINDFPNVNIWLDDFGTNQSNFDIVNSNKITFSAIKVSKELFWSLLPEDLLFLDSLLRYLAKHHNVIVEGIESNKHVELVSKIPNVLMQGYYFSQAKKTINV
ncbi:MAG: EAL domain-containing protein (putative c-di-GMP-specific phosphodiesterase class I) [Francisellaceae bacterium]|jgi:EAL domain-containing protein (putative c-di-GMP-specific phosphodiesterase class I)